MAKPQPWLKPALIVGSAVPAVGIAWRARSGSLGANPVAEALNELGLLALIFLLASLACTPLNSLFKWGWPARVRRLLGVTAFVYASLHFLTYVGVDQLFDWKVLLEDVTQR